jgi:ABC-type thiamine transport system substrate-binding protein
MRALSSLEAGTIKAMAAAFKAEYPFLDVHVEELSGTDANQRFILEMKGGMAKDWDAAHIGTENYSEYLPYLKKLDILGMARNRVLRITEPVIDPVQRNVVAVTSTLQVVVYNTKLLPPDRAPNTWEDFLKPDFKGRKIVADIRPTEIATLVPAWGLEKTLDFSRKLAAQQPIWVRGATRTITAITAGEYEIFIGPNYHTVRRAQEKDPAKILGMKVPEPIPARLSDTSAVLNTSSNPYAALLWLEFLVSPKGQKIADEHEPYGASFFISGSAQESVTRGKKLSLVDWEHFTKMQGYQDKVVEAYGFPKAERK